MHYRLLSESINFVQQISRERIVLFLIIINKFVQFYNFCFFFFIFNKLNVFLKQDKPTANMGFGYRGLGNL